MTEITGTEPSPATFTAIGLMLRDRYACRVTAIAQAPPEGAAAALADAFNLRPENVEALVEHAERAIARRTEVHVEVDDATEDAVTFDVAREGKAWRVRVEIHRGTLRRIAEVMGAGDAAVFAGRVRRLLTLERVTADELRPGVRGEGIRVGELWVRLARQG